jgi:hypothetical protein
MRQTISRRADDVRSTADRICRIVASWHADLAALRVPPMPFSLSASDAANLVSTVPGIRAVHDLPHAEGRGKVFNALLWTVQRLPLFDPVRPLLILLEFG